MATDFERLEYSFDEMSEAFDLLERAMDRLGAERLTTYMRKLDRSKELDRIYDKLTDVYEDLMDILPGMEMEIDETFGDDE